jgi:hypothetical protein
MVPYSLAPRSSRHWFSAVALVAIMLGAAVLPSGCSKGVPGLTEDQIGSMEVVAVRPEGAGSSFQETLKTKQSDITSFVAALNKAKRIKGARMDVSPMVSVGVRLKDGTTIVVEGGGTTFATVKKADSTYEVRGPELTLWFDQIQYRDVATPVQAAPAQSTSNTSASRPPKAYTKPTKKK